MELLEKALNRKERPVQRPRPLKVPFVDLRTQYQFISDEVDEKIKEVLTSADFILGAKVAEFEKAFAGYCGVEYGTGVASGTDALHLSLAALGIGKGDEVITQANTFIATLLAISYTGATPVLVDVDPMTMNMDVEALGAAVTPKTRAILPVHMYGRTSCMDGIKETAARHGIFIVEDACQAHGARHYSDSPGFNVPHRAGNLGDIAAFSFYPGKNLGAYGDGGLITTDNPVLHEKVRILRNYGQSDKHHHIVKGYNSRLDTLQAAVLLVKLRRLDRWNSRRVSHAVMYSELLRDVPEVITPEFDKNLKNSHVFHLYVVRARNRDALIKHLEKKSVSTGIHYPVPAHLHQAFVDLGYRKGDFPITEHLSEEIVSLPMYPELGPSEIEYVAESIREFYNR